MFIIILDIHTPDILINKTENRVNNNKAYQQIHRHNNI